MAGQQVNKPTTKVSRAGRNLPAAIAVGVALGAMLISTLLFAPRVWVAVVAVAVVVATYEVVRRLREGGFSIPLVPLLNLMAIPDAVAAAPGLVIGFLDQFVPSIIAGGIASPVTSFVLAGLSVTQLIFMAETGVLIHRSKIPLPIRYLAAVFLIRTAIALPMLVTIAHWINR
jgi:nucleoside recognition membrane protein YjiH